MATPVVHATSPAMVNTLGRSRATMASNRAIQIGDVATTRAAIPVATALAEHNPPFPPSRGCR